MQFHLFFAVLITLQPIFVKISFINLSLIIIPDKISSFSRVNVILGVSNFFGYGSTKPGTHSPIDSSSMSLITLQKAISEAFGSAPLSKRLEASVDIPSDFALFLIVAALKYALSINIVFVSSETALSKPPIIPARANGEEPFVINNSFGEPLRLISSNVERDSPFLPFRISISLEFILS